MDSNVIEPTGRVPAPKTFDYIPPRMDADAYQVAVPQWEGDVLTDGRQMPLASHAAPAAYSADFSPPETVNEFLQLCRSLFGDADSVGSAADPASPHPSDARALEYLASFGYNLNKACFKLFVDLSVGKDLHLTQQSTAYVDKQPANMLLSEYLHRAARPQGVFGAYVPAVPPVTAAGPVPAAVATAAAAAAEEDPVPTAVEGSEGVSSRSLRVQSTDRIESKRRWLAVLEGAAGALLGKGAHRMPLFAAQALLDEAAAIPVHFTALGSAGSAAQAADDYNAWDRLRGVSGELVKRVAYSREWLSEMRDVLYKCNINIIIADPQPRRNVISLAALGELAKKADTLDFPAAAEEAELKGILSALALLAGQMRHLLGSMRYSPLIRNSMAPARQCLPICPYGLPDLESRMLAASGYSMEPMDKQIVEALTWSLDQILDSGSAASGAGSIFSAAAGRHVHKQIPLDDLEQLLSSPAGKLVHVSECGYWAAVSVFAREVDQRVCCILNTFAALEGLVKVYEEDKKYYCYARVKALSEALCVYPILLPNAGRLAEALLGVARWIDEVNNLDSLPTRRNNRKGMVSMRRVEQLGLQGLRWPFRFPVELARIRDKKEAAKGWLEKLKKTFGLATRGRGRKPASSEAEGSKSEAEKMSLADYQELLLEGEDMYIDEDEADSAPKRGARRGVLRDLDKAGQVVETAAEWVERVRGLVAVQLDDGYRGLDMVPNHAVEVKAEAGGVETTESEEEYEARLASERGDLLAACTSLVEEADCMPVRLEETEALRLQVQAMGWALRVRPLLRRCVLVARGCAEGMQRPLWAEVLEARADILKVRAAAGTSSEVPATASLPEEVFLHSLGAAVDRVLVNVKKVVSGREVRKGTALSVLLQLDAEVMALNVSLDADSGVKVLRNAIDAVCRWCTEHAAVLSGVGAYDPQDQQIVADWMRRHTPEEVVQPPSAAVIVSDDSSSSSGAPEEVQPAALELLARSLVSLAVDFPSARLLRSRADAVSAWLSRYRDVAAQYHNILSQAVTTSSGEVLWELSDRHASSVVIDESFLLNPRPFAVEQQLEALLEETRFLSVQLTAETRLLEKTRLLLRGWAEKRVSALEAFFHKRVSEVRAHWLNGSMGYLPFLTPEEVPPPKQQFPDLDSQMSQIAKSTAEAVCLRAHGEAAVKLLVCRQLLLLECAVRDLLLCAGRPWGDTSSGVVRELQGVLKEVRRQLTHGGADEEVQQEDVFLAHRPFLRAGTAEEVPMDVDLTPEGVPAAPEAADEEVSRKSSSRPAKRRCDEEVPASTPEVVPSAPPPHTSSHKKQRRTSSAEAAVAAAPPASASSVECAAYLTSCGVAAAALPHLLALLCALGPWAADHPFVRLLDLYCTSLEVFAQRLVEVEEWKLKLQLKANGKSVEGLRECLLSAQARGLRCATHTSLAHSFVSSSKWMDAAHAMLSEGGPRLAMDELRDFLKEADAVLYDTTEEVAALKGELKKAKAWKAAFDASSTAAVSDLLQQAAGIKVDLSLFTDTLSTSTQAYCLCRSIYHGQMIGCDVCEDWYHFPCVNLSAQMADKCDKYICIKCALKSSVVRAGNISAIMTNKWADKMNVLRARDITIEKHQKRLDKLEREKARLCPSISTPSAAPPAPAAPETQALAAEDNPLVLPLLKEMEEVKAALVATRKDRFREALKYKEIVSWMYGLQRMLWASNGSTPPSTGTGTAPAAANGSIPNGTSEADRAALIRLGRPFDPTDPAFYPFPLPGPVPNPADGGRQLEVQLEVQVAQADSAPCYLFPNHPAAEGAATLTVPFPVAGLDYARSMRCLSHYLAHLLPLGGRELLQYAATQGLSEVEDVLVLMDALRWMSWCAAVLEVLRYPPPTPLLRECVEVTKGLRFSDDKIIKFLATNLQRASVWKARVRKYAAQGKRLDEAKLAALAAEGAALPVTSRLRGIVKAMADKHLPGGAAGIGAAVTPSVAGAGVPEANTGRGRAIKPVVKAASRIVVPADLPDSSDEEDSYQHLLRGVTKRRAVSNSWARRLSYPAQEDMAANLAPPVGLVWPPALTLRMAHTSAAML